jgi:hypothetical protein
MIFRHPYLNRMKSDLRNHISATNSALHFLHIHHLDFYLKKKILPSNFEKIIWNNKFLKVPPCRNYFLWKSRWYLLLMRPWTLNLDYKTFPFLYFGILLAYPPNFYWISKLTTIRAPHQKNFFFSFNCYNLAIRVVTWTEIFSTNIYCSQVAGSA